MLELKELEELSPTSWLGVKVKCLVAIKWFSNWIFHFSLLAFHFRQKTYWFTIKKRPTFASKVAHLRPVNDRLMI